MKRILLLLFFWLMCQSPLFAQKLPLLSVSADKRYLQTAEGKPFFWLGDTAWELLHRLNREETTLYLEDRARKGFTVVQTVILAELDGLNAPNALGEKPLRNLDPTKPNEAYFKHVDAVVAEAEQKGLYVALLPTWGDKFNKAWGVGPEIFTPKNAETFGAFLGKRYAKSTNLLWILGGDRPPADEEDYRIIRAMARGLQKTAPDHLIAYHPAGGKSASEYFLNDPWLHLDLFQTGHHREVKDYQFVQKNRQREPVRPVINAEPRYENHPNQFKPLEHGWLDDTDVRQSAWWTMLAGAAGYTYGCHDIWQMYTLERAPVSWARTSWQEALQLPGAHHVGLMKKLLGVFPWQSLQPDQSIIRNENPAGEQHMVGALAGTGDFLIIYSPFGLPIRPDLSKLKAERVRAYWYNPRDGRSKQIGEFSTTDKPEFTPWSTGRGSDFVLVVQDVRATYHIPK